MKFLILPILVLSLLAGPAYALVSDFNSAQDISDEQLKELAVKNGIIPAVTDEEYIQEETQKENTIKIWILMSREEKIGLMDFLKQTFKERDGATVSLPSEFYVDTLNAFLFDSITGDQAYIKEGKGIGNFLKTIAVMEGDFDDGTNKEDLLKQRIGEETAQGYKERQPEKYEALFE